MKIAPVDIAYLFEVFRDQAEPLLEHWQGRTIPEREDPARLVSAMGDLCKVLRGVEAHRAGESDHRPPDPTEVEALGNFGLQLLNDLSELAAEVEMPECARQIENLCLPLGVWIARQGSEIRQLAPVVNALAWYANQSSSPEDMRELYGLASEIMEAVSPSLMENATAALHPWRLLVINRAIIATRTLVPEVMEPAFTTVVEQMPDDAARFFEEGMQQMDRVGYPQQVREVMERFHALFNKARTLH